MRTMLAMAALALAAASAAAGRAEAQVFSPSYQAPTRAADLGVYLAEGFPGGDDLALELMLRRGFGAYDLGLRGGIVDQGDGLAVTAGADYRNPLEIDTAPLVVAVTGGAQAVLGDRSGLAVAAGVTVGGTWAIPEVSITPYVHPRIALLHGLAPELDGVDTDDTELAVVADAGVDLVFSPRWALRLAFGFSETADFGIGLAWR